MKPNAEGLHRIANCDNPHRRADIVFIHGLWGNSQDTWQHGDGGEKGRFFWPEELGKDLPDCGIWSVGYPASVTKWGKQGMIIDRRAGNVAYRLALAELGSRPLFFVSHSMGGLIVKSLVVHARNKNWKRVANSVRGIVFCGTPHRGAKIADAATKLTAFFGGSQAYVKEMRANADQLDLLHDDFLIWQKSSQVPIESFVEGTRLYRKQCYLRWLPIGVVVPRASANPSIPDHVLCDVDEDHLTMVKPPDRDHIVYAGVLDFIGSALSKTPAPAIESDPAPASTAAAPLPAKDPERGDWLTVQSYGLSSYFTGRAKERKMLTEWLNKDKKHPLLSLRALGGFGKSALAWYWIKNDVEPDDWPKVVWWSFYGGEDVSFDNFVCQTLDYLSGGKNKLTRPTATDIKTLVDMLHAPGTLLVLDGFERLLRTYGGMNAAYQGDEAGEKPTDRDCVSPLAETFLRDIATQPDIGAKVLLTTRLRPHVLEARDSGLLAGSHEEVLEQMHPDDAVDYFRAQNIRGTDAEIKTACEYYGYHPLSLSLLAGLIVNDLKKPCDIVVAERVDVSGDLKQNKHHVLEAAYKGLSDERKSLLSHIAAFRNPMDYEAIETVAEKALTSVATLEADLKDLVARDLLHIYSVEKQKSKRRDTTTSRFDLHPIVRKYAYDRLVDPDAAHSHMRDYFAAVPPPDKVTCLEDLTPVIELYHHTVRAGQFDEACTLFRDRIAKPLYYQLGAYQLIIDLLRGLFPDGEDQPPHLQDESAQAWTLNVLAISYSLSAQPRRAAPLFEQTIALVEKRGDKKGVASGMGNLATQQLTIGALRDAETNHRRRIAISLETEDESSEAIGRQELGRLLAYRGVYAESGAALATALKIFEKQTEVQSQCIIWAYRAQRELHLLRSEPDSEQPPLKSTLQSAQRALELAEGGDPNIGGAVVPRDLVRAHWLLGAAHCASGQHKDAERHLSEALERCRGIGAVDSEADILIDLARLSSAKGAPKEAKRLAEEALFITERSGYVLQGADAHLELAKLAQEAGDKQTALEHARQAKDLAYCDGPPDYTYKAAYDEACELVDKLQS